MLDRCSLLNSLGANGGALVNFGPSLSLSFCTISGNRARFSGGISNYGRLSITSSTISGNTALYGGGGVGNAYRGTMGVSNSTFASNRAGGGGAIHNYGAAASLFQSTISGNISSISGGGILNEASRGAAAPPGVPLNATLSVRACTIALNRAVQGGGLDNFAGGARAIVYLRSTILASNLASTNRDLGNDDALQNGGFNLIGGAAGVAPLANNGGPTLTHVLLPGSRAINTGDPTPGSPFDQRGLGFLRVRGGRADIGAFEVQQVVSPLPTPIPTATLAPTPLPTLAPTPTPAPTSTPAPVPTPAPGQVRNPANGHVYELVSTKLTWGQARLAAEERSFGTVRGHLATVTSQAEQDFLAQQFGQEEAWIGGIQPTGSPEPAGGFTWVNGEPFSYTNWREGEPNDAPNPLGSEDAILFTTDDTWNDVPKLMLIDYYFVEYDLSPTAARGAPPASVKLTANSPSLLSNLVVKLATTLFSLSTSARATNIFFPEL